MDRCQDSMRLGPAVIAGVGLPIAARGCGGEIPRTARRLDADKAIAGRVSVVLLVTAD